MTELQSLIEKCKRQDRKAQFELYKIWFQDLMRMATRYKRNREDAAAVVNNAFFKVLTCIDKYDNNTPFEGWIRQIMKNTIIDEYRKESRRMEVPAQILNEEGDDIFLSEENIDYNLVEKEMSAGEAEKILYALEENERIVFNMYEFEGYAHKEIAEALSISERTSKRYLAAAKKRLVQMLSNSLVKAVI